MGALLESLNPADLQDRVGALLLLSHVLAGFPRLHLLWADGGYAGWLVEWVLTIFAWFGGFQERRDRAPENLAVVQHIALNLVKQEQSSRSSVRTKRLRAGWDNTCSLKILRA
jgi:hypothetical protein